MRARNIKPSITKNEDLADLPFEARLLFCWLPMMADHEGRLEDRPRRIKAELFPYDDIDINGILTELHRKSFIKRYEVDQLGKFIQITKFKEHQHPHKQERAIPSKIPEFNPENNDSDNNGTTSEQLPKSNGIKRADSLNLIPDSFNLSPERESRARAPDTAALPPENRQIQDLKNFKLSNGEPDPKEMASVMDAYVSKIKFAPKSSKNLYFVENCLRHLKISEIIDSIEKMAHKYKIENTPSRFKLSPERFFDAEHIRHVLSDNFEICPPKSSETASLTEGQEWEKRTRQNMVDSGNTSFDNESKISPIDALDLIRSYLDRWRYGLRPDMCERWLRWLTGCDKAPIAKAFDALLQECEKPFPFKRLSELSIKYMSNNEALENVKKWKKEQTSEV